MTRSVCIDAPAAAVWAAQAIHLWVRAIERSYCPERSRGVGAVRVCELRQATIRETIVDWNEGHSFTYRGEGAPMLTTATNRWAIEARGENQTLVTTTAEAVLSGGMLGRMIEPLMRGLFERMGAQSLASLKFFIENGRPYEGPTSELPAPSLAC